MYQQKMYHLVLYSLCGRQQGIRAYHSAKEYYIQYGETPEYQQWVRKNKTVIVLDGGTSNRMGWSEYEEAEYGKAKHYGSMEQSVVKLDENKIKYACFYEPDCNNATTAIAFLVDERVWDKEKYPDISIKGIDPNIIDVNQYLFNEYEKLYGKEVAFLRTFLKNFRLASN